jgi:fructosamine-3-kinase
MDKPVKNKLEEILGEEARVISGIGGGSIADSNIIETSSGKRFFLKTGFSSSMFINEANGLKELRKPGCIKIPEVIAADRDFLLLELVTPGPRIKNFWKVFGRQFAEMHKFTARSYGFYENNYIGATPQMNIPSESEQNNWVEFYLNKRLGFQIELAEKNGYGTPELKRAFSKLAEKIDTILEGSEESPALLHGDLWSGNYITGSEGEPVLIDPAVYYGHREADLAMTYLFGGFSNEFYKAYNEAYPLKDGWEYRLNIYKLYHVLNHLNLFGTGYYGQALRLMEYYL